MIELVNVTFYEYSEDADDLGSEFFIINPAGTPPCDALITPILGNYTGPTPEQSSWWAG